MPNTFGSNFKFTKDDLYNMVVGALKQESTQGNATQGNTPKPSLLQGLLAKSKIKANQ
jgi:hypothetical protein